MSSTDFREQVSHELYTKNYAALKPREQFHVDAIDKFHGADVDMTRLVMIAHIMAQLANRMYEENRDAANAYFGDFDSYDATQRLRAAITPKGGDK